jgi:hypothetical protein
LPGKAEQALNFSNVFGQYCQSAGRLQQVLDVFLSLKAIKSCLFLIPPAATKFCLDMPANPLVYLDQAEVYLKPVMIILSAKGLIIKAL